MNYPDPAHSRLGGFGGNHNEIQSTGDMSHEAFPNGPVHWKATSVVEWVESLSAATEAAEGQEMIVESMAPRRMSMPQPLTINSTRLSAPSTVPPTAPWAARRLTDNVTTNAANPTPMPETLPKLWNAENVHTQDPLAWIYTGEILALAHTWETLCERQQGQGQMQGYQSALCDKYKKLFERLDYMVERIAHQQSHGSIALEEGEPRMLLDRLYQDTIRALNELIQSTQLSGLPGTQDDDGPSTPHPKKKDLSPYMTEWLRAHWTNPYPDEDGLEEMARDCGTSTTVVSNWLINARTRKWRPAIIKAVEQNRPACIFAGERFVSSSPQQQQQHNCFHRQPKRIKTSPGGLGYHYPHH
eukprot:CAMPEP_0168728892 /NCGR_PEP_ID=MMETSP0724-20121128/5916_1 /TAXON_ID=265536 /ORGANISM="Amphiprora sp., Strain CCMP467" /LENGTH=356 /DNA_ID=CAMNT_0008775747 /DNA_START=115 /DNA_END=1185 /DNA_ORIENTATION=-